MASSSSPISRNGGSDRPPEMAPTAMLSSACSLPPAPAGWQLLSQGAEARVFALTLCGRPAIAKERFKKRYRHPTLDEKLTARRCVRLGVWAGGRVRYLLSPSLSARSFLPPTPNTPRRMYAPQLNSTQLAPPPILHRPTDRPTNKCPNSTTGAWRKRGAWRGAAKPASTRPRCCCWTCLARRCSWSASPAASRSKSSFAPCTRPLPAPPTRVGASTWTRTTTRRKLGGGERWKEGMERKGRREERGVARVAEEEEVEGASGRGAAAAAAVVGSDGTRTTRRFTTRRPRCGHATRTPLTVKAAAVATRARRHWRSPGESGCRWRRCTTRTSSTVT